MNHRSPSDTAQHSCEAGEEWNISGTLRICRSTPISKTAMALGPAADAMSDDQVSKPCACRLQGLSSEPPSSPMTSILFKRVASASIYSCMVDADSFHSHRKRMFNAGCVCQCGLVGRSRVSRSRRSLHSCYSSLTWALVSDVLVRISA